MLMRLPQLLLAACLFASFSTRAADAQTVDEFDYRVLATKKTSTMEKEINEAAEEGYIFRSVMGGQTSFGGSEAVVVMQKQAGAASQARRLYKLLATSKTSTMEKEMQQLGEEGFEYRGQTVFATTFGGQEVVVIMELDVENPTKRVEYRLLATKKTSTMQNELRQAGLDGFDLMDLTVAKTAFGGTELVSLLRREAN